MCIKEMIISLMIGFIAQVVFDAIIMASSIVGYQMGFGTANLMVPDANIQMNSFKDLHRIFLIIIFLSLNLHHIYLVTIADSFKIIPFNVAVLDSGIGSLLIEVSAAVFVTSVKLSAPVLVALMFKMAALGLVARTVPQMNIFTMIFPTIFFIGLSIYIASLPYFPEMVRRLLSSNYESIKSLLILLSP